MRRLLICCSALIALTVLVAEANAATLRPVITSFSPAQVKVGQTLILKGKHFRRGARNNRIYFSRASDMKTVLTKPANATTSRIEVVVPQGVESFLTTDASGNKLPTRFRLRVITKAFGRYTAKSDSPLILSGVAPKAPEAPPPPADCDKDGVPDTADTDDDNDGLTDATELAIGTGVCNRDTDGDGNDDTFEYYSALDLNNNALPYPGKRPYPNALDPSDPPTDYDGDSLTLKEESAAWLGFSSDGIRRSGRPTSLASLSYSDGLQQSRVVTAPAGGTLANWVLDFRPFTPDGLLYDDERDADGDGISNFDEQHGQFIEVWWPAQHDGTNEPKESKYPNINFLDVADLSDGLALTAPDMDGDGVLDGYDDQDHDGLNNQFELRRPDDWLTSGDPWAYVNPFNPCKPFNSSRCHAHPPFGYYSGDGAPPVGPDPPAGYPGSAPAIP
jgi:hypothetical protein